MSFHIIISINRMFNLYDSLYIQYVISFIFRTHKVCFFVWQVILTLQSLEPIHAKNFFYPHLYPLYPFDTQQISKNSSDNQLKSVSVESSDESKWCLLLREAIPLRREAMIVSSSSDFLLNNGSDLIIYRFVMLEYMPWGRG